ncbi:Response regulator receiver domain-containing protein [Croceitalea dokdonensis DOKDO 023]|uniref:Response regulator receiver domain-containing protein n=1 Tax=Croceitalea dokdonensis DOKDO 023 TaxID=1300341 RepID=A0A0P7AIG2_9FLAO|nr:Response regulator receiver domain-containing protein [Croceitalea dokdonensis DOKDO 023]
MVGVGLLKSVLLVDDDETTNFLNSLFLNQVDSSLEVNLVSNGQEALSFLKQHGPDILPCLIILDTNMPVLDGWGFLDRYPMDIDASVRKKIKIVMITAVDTDVVVANAMKNPYVDDTAQKPLSDITFKKLIDKHFR